MTKAVFFDIDGTLVSFKTHTVPQSAIEAINALRRKGIKVFIATGRAFFQIPPLEGLIFDGYITFNGSYCITDKNETVVRKPLPQTDIEALIRYLEEVKHFPCSFMLKDRIMINYINETVEYLAEYVEVPVPPVANLREAAREDVFQINVYGDEMLEKELMEKVFTHCNASRWISFFFDINKGGISKQTGIDEFLEYYGLRLDETMAFGDGGNDIPMLKHVAVGIAMGNANDEVKAVADYVTDSVDEAGIYNALKHFGLIDV